MDSNKQADLWTNKAINSLDDSTRATPRPYLLTRINERLKQSKSSIWERAGWFIGKPAVAFSGLALLIIINVLAIVNSTTGATDYLPEQSVQLTTDDFSNTIATIYDIENP
jgi:hypothetical protein